MTGLFRERVLEPLVHLLYPHLCSGCSNDVESGRYICYKCQTALPHTNYADLAGNPIEKRFWGRVDIQQATALLYFPKEGSVRNMIYEMKYKGNRKLGVYLGNMMGAALVESKRFNYIDLIIPLPLHTKKKKMRGYNQSALISEGISDMLGVPSIDNIVIRSTPTESQTRKTRSERWKNVKDTFSITDTELLRGKHILLVDDVLTTGATIDACASSILKVDGVKLSIAVLAVATN